MKSLRVLFLVLLLVNVFFVLPVTAKTFKIATAAPEGSQWMKEMRSGAEKIKQRTEGRVKIKFYAGGVMGNDKSVMRKIRIGQLQGGAFVSGSLDEVDPDISLFSLPMVFRSYEEVDYVRKAMDRELIDHLEQAGFACFGFAEGGFAYIMSPTPIRSIEDARGLKIWVPEGDTISYRGMESIGLAPVVLPITDVMTGLQASLIEVVASSPIGALAFQWHTKVKYVTSTPLSYLYGTLVIDKRYFNKLSADDQKVVREVMEAIYADLDRSNRKENQEAVKALTAQGIEFIDPPADETAKWRSITADLNRQMGKEGLFSVGLYDKIVSTLEQFRAGKKDGTSH